MKPSVNTLFVMFVLAFMGTIVTVVIHFPFWITFGTAVATLLLAVAGTVRWMQLMRDLVDRSNAMLNKKHQPVSLSLNQFSLLIQNIVEATQKFHEAADLISNLTNPEKVSPNKQGKGTDPISIAVSSIRSQLEKVREEEECRTWVTQGVADIGEVLKNKLPIDEYGYQIIRFLVRHMQANQAKFFVEYTDGDGSRYLELTASYAYDKRRYGTDKIHAGHGLLGQNMLEKDFVFITDVPPSYIKITSGLGEAVPRNIIIAPLIIDDVYCGAIEIASLAVLLPHQIEFLKLVCDNIASEILAVKNMKKTETLLAESRMLTEELKQSEEEMKQNLEELAATQEEMNRKQSELTSYLNGINNTIASVEISVNGVVRVANEIFLKVMGYTPEDISNKRIEDLMGNDPVVAMMWENLQLGTFFSGEFKMKNKAGKDVWLTGTFNPIIVSGTQPEKFMMFAHFTTQEKEKMNDLSGMVNALKSTLPVLEFSPQFQCKTANEMAMKIFGFTRMDLRSKTIEDFISPDYHPIWQQFKDELLRTEVAHFIIPFAAGAETISYEVSQSTVKNLEGEVTKIILILVRKVDEEVPVLQVSNFLER